MALWFVASAPFAATADIAASACPCLRASAVGVASSFQTEAVPCWWAWDIISATIPKPPVLMSPKGLTNHGFFSFVQLEVDLGAAWL